MSNASSVASGNRRGSLWERLSSSFWFIPAILTAAGFSLSLVTQPLDRILQGTLNSLPAVISGGSSGASSVLAAISGSLITVIATVFSLTIVTLTLVSGQYSPRLLRSFMGDRGLQIVLRGVHRDVRILLNDLASRFYLRWRSFGLQPRGVGRRDDNPGALVRLAAHLLYRPLC